jgi:hypothetical protein
VGLAPGQAIRTRSSQKRFIGCSPEVLNHSMRARNWPSRADITVSHCRRSLGTSIRLFRPLRLNPLLHGTSNCYTLAALGADEGFDGQTVQGTRSIAPQWVQQAEQISLDAIAISSKVASAFLTVP